MVTVESRLRWWRTRSYYLGEEVTPKEITYVTYDDTGNPVIGKSVIVDITIYTKSGSRAVERMERWIVPNATYNDYATKPAYKRTYTLSATVRPVIVLRRKRWWR